MNGINVITEGLDAESSRLEFLFLFGPILSRLSEFHWVYEEIPLGFITGDEELAVVPDDDIFQDHAPPGTLFLDLAKYMKNDWPELYGFRSKPDTKQFLAGFNRAIATDGKWMNQLQNENWEGLMALYHERAKRDGTEANRFLDAHTDVCIFNIDGGFWQFYCRETNLVDDLTRHLTGIPGFEMSLQELLYRSRVTTLRSQVK